MTKLEMIKELEAVKELTNDEGKDRIGRVMVAMQAEQDKDVREWLKNERKR